MIRLPQVNLLIKPASSGCNLRCRYCFYADVAANRAIPNYGMMSEATLEKLVAAAFATAEQAVGFSFQGGEPTLVGLPFYERLIALEAKYNTRRLPVQHTIQTNGMLLDANWARFFREQRFLVGLSLDGHARSHDRYRVDAHGAGTHARVFAAARLLQQEHVEFNILSVVTAELARRIPGIYAWLRDQGFGYLQFIPAIDDFGLEAGRAAEWSLTAEAYGDFLCRLFDLWYDDYRRGRYVSIRHFDNWIQMLRGREPESCALRGVCTAYGVVEADGSIHPCDFYVLDEWQLGHIETDELGAMLTGEVAERFVRLSLNKAPACDACPWFAICRGGCRRDTEPPVADPDRPYGLRLSANRFCAAYKRFFPHAIGRMQAIARELGPL
ncbi:MAG: anaerobic sulfatase maturase [Bacillota bacterium]|nr:anaerobic sulfatase maturase [Bacillota bacterium]